MPRREHLFEVLEPPPHGLTALRATLRERALAKTRRTVFIGSLLGVATAALVMVWLQPSALETSYRHAWAQRPTTVDIEALGTTALEHVATTSQTVVMVRVSSLPTEP